MHLRLRISRMEFEEVVPFDFDPTVGNYLVHCHILEHEDKDMMQNMVVHSHNY
jgi:FtsP/CotA-like multicopper oxidase with cupredoxin domain